MPRGRLEIRKVEGSNSDLLFYFSFFSKFPNLKEHFDFLFVHPFELFHLNFG